jgi:hydroxypyruvate isomerase
LEEKPVFNPPQDLSNENRVRMAVQQWLEADNEVPQFVPPTAEEQRAMMGTVTARQLRHGLLNVSLDEADVEALIAAMPDEEERKRASIDWRTANEYERLHPLMVQISAALGLTPEQIDSLWTYYQTI